MWEELEMKLINWEKRFAEIWSKKGRNYLDTDREYLAKELPLLKSERNSVQVRLKKIEELIAKTRLLIDDLNENLCRKLSRGHSLAAVGQALVEEFGTQLEEDHIKGRKRIREFFEEHYGMSKAESRDLFSLLEEVGTLHYRVDLPSDFKDIPLSYYDPECEFYPAGDPGLIYELRGSWEIRA